MSIKAVVIRGDFTDAEFAALVAAIRRLDAQRPAANFEIVAVNPDTTGMEHARRLLEESLPPMPGRKPEIIAEVETTSVLTDADTRKFVGKVCPDCDQGDSMRPGPRGGIAQNYACERCGAEFNVVNLNGKPLMIHRNSPYGEPNLERLRAVFGIIL
jgi:hypothetical protein